MTHTLESTIRGWGGESVVVSYDPPTGTWMFVALHDTTHGPATGGTRMKVYDRPVDGLIDALRLAEGMTYKWAGVRMPFGGGKAVLAIPGPLGEEIRNGLLDRYAALLVSLKGAFKTGVDLGTTPEDLARIGASSGHAMGVSGGHSEDPGPYTALGVFVGIRAALAHRFGTGDMAGRSILIQGVGDVGRPLAGLLADAGATLVLCDVDGAAARDAAERLGAEVVEPADMWDTEVDVYAPCAIGATVNPETIPRMRCRIVAGSANNQLLTDEDADRLAARGILYAPDYIINAGGAVAFGHMAAGQWTREGLEREVVKIEATLTEIFADAEARSESPLAAARRRAEAYLSESA